jgi:hypothetical protein
MFVSQLSAVTTPSVLSVETWSLFMKNHITLAATLLHFSPNKKKKKQDLENKKMMPSHSYERVHDKIRDHYSKFTTIPSFETFFSELNEDEDEFWKKLKEKRLTHQRNHERTVFAKYFAEDQKDTDVEIVNTGDPEMGIGLFLNKTLSCGVEIKGIPSAFLPFTDREHDISIVEMIGTQRLMRGNVAFMNHACNLCADVVW